MISELEQRVLETITRREDIRFVRVSSTLIEQGDAVGAVVVSLIPASDSKWEAEFEMRAAENE